MVCLEYVGCDGVVAFTLTDIEELSNWLIEKTHNQPWLSNEELCEVNDCICNLKNGAMFLESRFSIKIITRINYIRNGRFPLSIPNIT